MDKKIDKKQFEFVSIDEKIFDTKFEGKPRSFLSDALIRFANNKVNLVATTIVLMVILLSILVPVLTLKDYTSANNPNMKYLPPRIPYLENIGILDGSIQVIDHQVDLDSYTLIDPSLGDVSGNRLYNPFYEDVNRFDIEFIKSGTLTNREIIGGRKNPHYVGGTNEIVLTKYDRHLIGYLESKPFYQGATITLDINHISEEGMVTVYVKPNNLPANISERDPEILEYYNKIGTISESGVTSLTVEKLMAGSLIIVFESTIPKDILSINSVSFKNPDDEELFFEGYELSQFTSIAMNDHGGQWIRANAVYTVSSFVYYKYNDIFANRKSWIENDEYDQLLAQYPEMADSIIYNDPNDHSKGWKFGEEGEFYLVEVIGMSNPVTGPDGKQYFSYRVVKNGILDSGFTELPYFLFGTDGKGRDLFAEIWLSLRTSLLLGVIVSAINIIIGVMWGAISGYFGGSVDFSMERFVEVLSSFPGLTVLTILYLQFGAGFGLLLIYLTYSGWIGIASVTRIQFYRYRGREYVLASRTLGAGHARLIFKHILPNGIGYIITSVILSIPAMILTESSLSFLGFGLGEAATLDFGLFKVSGLSLGIILYEGQNNMTAPGRFYLVLIPAIIIIIIMIAFNLFGNALRDAMNPSLRGQE